MNSANHGGGNLGRGFGRAALRNVRPRVSKRNQRLR